MIRLLIWLLLIYVGYRIIKALFSGKTKQAINRENAPEATITHRDPVCGLYVSESEAVVGKLDGARHYFCSMGCLEKYREQIDHPHSS